jgi:LacI family transcriptional regulator
MCVCDAHTYDGRLRIARYERYLRERGAAGEIQVHVTDQEPARSFALGQRLFAGTVPATAVFAASDTTAIGLMQAAFQAGLAIPDRLSIVGYDDIDMAAYTVPPLTTVSQTGFAMGQAAAGLLVEMVEGALDRTEVDDVVLTPSLVVRGSTAPPVTRIPA